METPLAVANYFLQKAFDVGEEVTPMKILKLVYIAHGWNLGINDESLINEAVQAWKYGPVIESVYHKFKEYNNKPITQLAHEFNNDAQYISPMVEAETEIELLDRVWDVYRPFNGLQLSTLTHKPNTPWYIVWNEQGGKDKSQALIPNDLIKAHYKQKINATAT